MAEYIDREAVYTDACQGCVRHGDELGSCYAEEPCYKLICAFANASTADVAPVGRGRWDLLDDVNSKIVKWNCDKCNHISIRKTNYCPNCGARMETEEK